MKTGGEESCEGMKGGRRGKRQERSVGEGKGESPRCNDFSREVEWFLQRPFVGKHDNNDNNENKNGLSINKTREYICIHG